MEFHQQSRANQFNVGDLYLGKVERTVSGLNAAFVDIGHAKDAFLHYLDMGRNFKVQDKYFQSVAKKGVSVPLSSVDLGSGDRENNANQTIEDLISPGQKILVKINKEAISLKGPRISCELSLPGRYVILLPFSDRVNVSRRIAKESERKRLVKLVRSIIPENFGAIVRTIAEKIDAEELHDDVQRLMSKWDKGIGNLAGAEPGTCVLREANFVRTFLRDLLNDSFDSIYVDDVELYEEVKEYMSRIALEKVDILHHYSSTTTQLFHHYDIEKQIRISLGRKVSVPGGGFLVIESTEALHVIDVNSGRKSHEEDQESNALNTNLDAVEEVALQIRLRDLGGIIIVDFIDMRERTNQAKVYSAMKKAMSMDRSRYQILPLTKFGLMQITRHRVRPETNLSTDETCSTCRGSGKVEASIGVADNIEKNVAYVMRHQKPRSLTLVVHPYLHAYFTKGLWSRRRRWALKYGIKIRVREEISLGLTECRYLDGKGKELLGLELNADKKRENAIPEK